MTDSYNPAIANLGRQIGHRIVALSAFTNPEPGAPGNDSLRQPTTALRCTIRKDLYEDAKSCAHG